MGPLAFGTTKDVNGTYEIAYKINILAQWGRTVYRAWFEKTVLAWCQERTMKQ